MVEACNAQVPSRQSWRDNTSGSRGRLIRLRYETTVRATGGLSTMRTVQRGRPQRKGPHLGRRYYRRAAIVAGGILVAAAANVLGDLVMTLVRWLAG